jgi:hypothetical protein
MAAPNVERRERMSRRQLRLLLRSLRARPASSWLREQKLIEDVDEDGGRHRVAIAGTDGIVRWAPVERLSYANGPVQPRECWLGAAGELLGTGERPQTVAADTPPTSGYPAQPVRLLSSARAGGVWQNDDGRTVTKSFVGNAGALILENELLCRRFLAEAGRPVLEPLYVERGLDGAGVPSAVAIFPYVHATGVTDGGFGNQVRVERNGRIYLLTVDPF